MRRLQPFRARRTRVLRRALLALLALPALVAAGGCSMVGAGASTPPTVAGSAPSSDTAPPGAATAPEASGDPVAANAPADGAWREEGMASWYGEPFHGRTTASGAPYDMNAPTAAHKTLPFGSRVRVDNLDNGRSTTLTITDRGPFIEGRIIDVSRWGAEALGMTGAGVARVRITVVEAPSTTGRRALFGAPRRSG